MQYNDALKAWGFNRLTSAGYKDIDPDTVRVEMDFEEAWVYSSYTYGGGTAEVRISGNGRTTYGVISIPLDEFNFAAVLGEIVDTADGVVTSG